MRILKDDVICSVEVEDDLIHISDKELDVIGSSWVTYLHMYDGTSDAKTLSQYLRELIALKEAGNE